VLERTIEAGELPATREGHQASYQRIGLWDGDTLKLQRRRPIYYPTMATLFIMFAMIALFSGGSVVEAWKSAVHGYEDDAGFHSGTPFAFRGKPASAAESAIELDSGLNPELPPAVC
jgi:hypothetical protein